MIVHADNFSIYGDDITLLTQGIYASANRCNLRVDPDGISPGRVLFPARTGGNDPRETWRYVNQGGAQATVGAALRTWLVDLPISYGLVAYVQLRSAGNVLLADLAPGPDGSLRFTTYNSAGTLLHRDVTPIPVITAKGWYHIELKYTVTGALADYEVRVEGLEVLKGEGIPAPVELPAMWAGGFYNNTEFCDFYIKDLVLWDGRGTYNNDFLGSVLVTNTTPTEDIELNWTPVGGPNGYSILDNIPPNASQYISAPYDSEGDPMFPPAYVAALSDLPEETTSVKAVISYVRAAKSDGGDGGLQVGLISNSSGVPVGVDGLNRPITVAQTYWRDVFEVDPSTGLPWLPGAVNGAYVKINRTA